MFIAIQQKDSEFDECSIIFMIVSFPIRMSEIQLCNINLKSHSLIYREH